MDAKPAFEQGLGRLGLRPRPRTTGPGLRARTRTARDAWVDLVLRDVVGWAELLHDDLASLPVAPAVATSPRPRGHGHRTGALVRGDGIGALVLVVDPVDSLRDIARRRVGRQPDRPDGGAAASGRGADRRSSPTVAGGRWSAPARATMAASGIVDALTWIEEPRVRDAFLTLMRRSAWSAANRRTGCRRCSTSPSPPPRRSPRPSAPRSAGPSSCWSRRSPKSAADARGRGEPDPLPADRGQVYEAAVTVMMRVVFLLFAEERGLLPQGRAVRPWATASAASSTPSTGEPGRSEEALDATYLTWHRLLATSPGPVPRRVVRGHADARLRRLAVRPRPVPVPHRTPANTAPLRGRGQRPGHAARAARRCRSPSCAASRPAGSPSATSTSSRSATSTRACSATPASTVDEVTLGLIGKAGDEPEIPLAELEELAAAHADPHDARRGDHRHGSSDDQPAAKPPTEAALAKAYRSSARGRGRRTRAARRHATTATLRDRLRPCRRDRSAATCATARSSCSPAACWSSRPRRGRTPARTTRRGRWPRRSSCTRSNRSCYAPGPHQTADRDRVEAAVLRRASSTSRSPTSPAAPARSSSPPPATSPTGWSRPGPARAPPIGEPARPAPAARSARSSPAASTAPTSTSMAVEMCKLSLWLVSLDPKLPFSFVDDKVLHGNSLLGLTDVRQLKAMHIDPDKITNAPSLFDLDVDAILRRAADLRRRLATEVDDAIRSAPPPPNAASSRELQETVSAAGPDRRRRDRRRTALWRQARQGAGRGLREPADRRGRGLPCRG